MQTTWGIATLKNLFSTAMLRDVLQEKFGFAKGYIGNLAFHAWVP